VRSSIDPHVRAEYEARGFWGRRTVGNVVAEHARNIGTRPAWVTADLRCSWREYDERASDLARALLGAGLLPGDRVAVVLPDGPAVHVAYVAVERAGMVAVGIGARAGEQELAHLIGRTGARGLVTEPARGRRDDVEVQVFVDHHGDAGSVPRGVLTAEMTLGPNDLYLLNSTSGTTGLPKCVMHTENRWFYFHQLAVAAGDLVPEDRFVSCLPAPFGFALWTTHFTPTILGAPTVVMERFDANVCLDLMERERSTVLSCVSTQFMMLLDAQAERPRDLSSLRCMFTGGEAVPYERAAEFEDATGATVLQFYGSNETGALSATTLRDSRDRRLRTAGRVIDDMQVRLFDPDGADVTGYARRGVPGCRGAATCIGYLDDDAANAELFTKDGWMLMGDIVEIDDYGYLTVVGRTSDFIIRGGKNISAPAVEEQIATHPAIRMVAAVAMPDPVFGERVCAFVELRSGSTLPLDELCQHLAARGVSKEWFPERLEIRDALPRSSGGKVAKGALRRAARALAQSR
jgi:acyl-CoA synthetase